MQGGRLQTDQQTKAANRALFTVWKARSNFSRKGCIFSRSIAELCL
jgi:hypothetical protein